MGFTTIRMGMAEAAHSIEGGDSGDGKGHLNNREGERRPEVSQT